MSPVLSPSAAEIEIDVRRRPARQSALFPPCPDVQSPKRLAGDDAGADAPAGTGLCGNNSGSPATDCPPPLPATGGVPRRAEGWTRGEAAGKADATARCTAGASARCTAGASAPLVGIARLAASSPVAETSRKSEERPEYFLLPVRSILNRCDSDRVPFEWTINPYRGCEFGCKYCYARYTHEYMELDGGQFEKKIFVKQNAAPLLAQDVTRKYSYQRAGSQAGAEHIAIGTATDPYQPAEREYGVTRACLEELAKREGLSLSVITKSNQIVRDIDVFRRIAARSELSLNITITTMRRRLARVLEPRAPRPDLRLAAVRQLREAGLRVGVSASPLIPGITDREGDLEEVAAAAADAGAQWFFSGVLFLMPASAKQFLPFIREKFPRLARQYEQWYARHAYAPEGYRKKIAERVALLREKHGFHTRPFEELQKRGTNPQLSLAWSPAA
jgi:DNA repair photolyase